MKPDVLNASNHPVHTVAEPWDAGDLVTCQNGWVYQVILTKPGFVDLLLRASPEPWQRVKKNRRLWSPMLPSVVRVPPTVCQPACLMEEHRIRTGRLPLDFPRLSALEIGRVAEPAEWTPPSPTASATVRAWSGVWSLDIDGVPTEVPGFWYDQDRRAWEAGRSAV